MFVRDAVSKDIPKLVHLDQNSYGTFGADDKYFTDKLTDPASHVLVEADKHGITGFAVFEVMKPGQEIDDFSDFHLSRPLEELWIHLVAFTTKSNYENIKTDAVLLKAVEKKARMLGCNIFCVPLSINHPYPKAFDFFEKHGYRKIGSIRWVASSSEKIDCYFYAKFL